MQSVSQKRIEISQDEKKPIGPGDGGPFEDDPGGVEPPDSGGWREPFQPGNRGFFGLLARLRLGQPALPAAAGGGQSVEVETLGALGVGLHPAEAPGQDPAGGGGVAAHPVVVQADGDLEL
jgi:hypothetical protein